MAFDDDHKKSGSEEGVEISPDAVEELAEEGDEEEDDPLMNEGETEEKWE